MSRKKWEEKVGKSFLNHLDETILEIGKDQISRRDLVEKMRCGNFAAAVRLHHALQDFEPRSVRDIARRVCVADLFAIKGVGEATIYVWMCVLEHSSVNPTSWLDSEVKIPTLYSRRRRARKLWVAS